MHRLTTGKVGNWVVLLSCLAYGGCANESQLDWHYKVLRVCDAIDSAAREGPETLFTQRQVVILMGEPDRRSTPSTEDSKRNAAIEQTAVENYIRYRRRNYGLMGEQLSPSREEKDAFRRCEIWVYEEAARYRTPLLGEPRFMRFTKYIVICEGGHAIGGGLVREE